MRAPHPRRAAQVESYCPCSGAWPSEFYNKLLPRIGDLVTLDRFFDASSSKLASQGVRRDHAMAGPLLAPWLSARFASGGVSGSPPTMPPCMPCIFAP